MKSKLQQLLDELKELKRFDVGRKNTSKTVVSNQGAYVYSHYINVLINKYSEANPIYKSGDEVKVTHCFRENCFSSGQIITLINYEKSVSMWIAQTSDGRIGIISEHEFEPMK